MLLYWEIPYVSHNQGRLDQYLYPYYERDVRQGRTTKEEAQELCDCYFIKLSQGPGACTTNVGGVKADGSDATNELSYMFIEAMMHTRLTGPWFAVLIHSKTPDDFLIKACQLCALGTGHPQFLNGDVMVAGGANGYEQICTTEVYDVQSGTWSVAADMLECRLGHTATVLRNGNPLVIGGFQAQPSDPVYSAEVYQPETTLDEQLGGFRP